MRKHISPCPKKSDHPSCKVYDIAYIRLGRKNLKNTLQYYLDFGLILCEETESRILFRSHGSSFPCWSVEKSDRDKVLGLGLFVSSQKDFIEISKIKNAVPNPSGRFGNAPSVTLNDPSGLPVDVVYKHQVDLEHPFEIKREWNKPHLTKRINIPQPAEFGPAKVIRLGHAVFLKQEFFENAQWYCDHFGFIPSDIQILPHSKEPVISFLRCDRGDQLTDHHSIVIATGIDDRLEHCAFELDDMEEIAKGRDWLLRKGGKSAWGIGRHLLGSQIFDYKRDPSGMLVEHFTDGDRFDDSVPTAYHLIGRDNLYQWGEDMPEDFLDTKLSFRKLKELWKGIFSGKQIRLQSILELKKVMDKSPRPWIKY
ncbi:VOC family protein [Leptospira ilyithenensis]|uniref:Extradiol dioxygenase n=1 Tax=Leptospira ilyithenensis TaxID=2484901 RepID=A0A4V3JXH1_9LEPT|nr:VOC family protein [Leptospira ilyithenensis]TGN16803.1 extradiol dioxygenase [Leptospira ilyithenensis]